MPVGVFQAECWTHFVAFLAQPQALSDFSNPKNRMYAMQKKTVMVAVAILAALLAGCGDKKSEPTPAAAPAAVTAPAPAVAPAAPAAAENELGKSVFGKTCSMCHAAGVAGAPKPGDKADWGPRIAQGKDTLYKHATEGYNGAKGAMPAKGGNPALKDDEVKEIVDFMVAKSE